MGRVKRGKDELRELTLETSVIRHSEGSCLISTGGTRVLCVASVEESVPDWRAGRGLGWVTAEYGMLPRSTHSRRGRERGGAGGRTLEIQRLIGRSLRAVTDFSALGERSIVVDCDVIEADGGTRTAAVTGGWVALALACRHLLSIGSIETDPLRGSVAAVSAGIVDGHPLLDLDYPEDRDAEVDLNVVATGDGRLVEVQGTAEGEPFHRDDLDRLVDLAMDGIRTLTLGQTRALEAAEG
jgi:ribonuclease PH